MVFGTFDPLHPGHLSYFKQARAHGDRLVCVIARDETVASVRGKEAMHTEEVRFDAVAACGHVDETVLGSTNDVFDVLSLFDPDVICLGYDQKSFTDKLPNEIERRGLTCEVVRLESHEPHIHKSSIVKGEREPEVPR